MIYGYTKRVTSNTVSRKADPQAQKGLGFSNGQLVQEFYWDEDADEQLREAIATVTGEDLVDSEDTNLVDGVIIWWRADDAELDDLVDVLIDAVGNLDNGGLVWVLTPKSGKTNHVAPADIEEAATTAGLHPTSTTTVGADWAGMRLSAPARQ